VKINIDAELNSLFPDVKIGCICSKVSVNPSDQLLSDEMNRICQEIETRYSPELIRSHPVVEMTKAAYRKMGQDPNRYRPAAESLLRRIASGKGLYQVNNMVDILNLVSIQTGFSIGGYDADTIIGNVRFGIGKSGEPYEGIGRGSLNIENLPVFRDGEGAFGTSTSDSVRTMVTEKTKRFLMVIPVFNSMENEPDKAMELAIQLLERYGNVSEYELFINI
jgi:DNA/RNA-binding domain of Phe-tRNA-synthetase-like protein